MFSGGHRFQVARQGKDLTRIARVVRDILGGQPGYVGAF